MNSCFIGCISLFIPLNWEAEEAALGLPRSWVAPRDAANASSYGKERPRVWAPRPVTFPHAHHLVTAAGPDYLLPPPEEKGSPHGVRDTHPGTPTRGHPWPKLALTSQQLLTWVCCTVGSSSPRITCGLPGDCKKLEGEVKVITVTGFGTIIH